MDIIKAFLCVCELMFVVGIVVARLVPRDEAQEWFKRHTIVRNIFGTMTIIGGFYFIFSVIVLR